MTLPGSESTLDLISKRSAILKQEFEDSKKFGFNEKYVLGQKLGEGQHASVWSCFERIVPRPENDSTPLLASKLDKDSYKPTTFAVKIVRNDDKETLIAHEEEFKILSRLSHKNVVRSIEMFHD